MLSPLYVGLVHYPVYDKNFDVITTAITNYDLHDISRSAKTYGVKKIYYYSLCSRTGGYDS